MTLKQLNSKVTCSCTVLDVSHIGDALLFEKRTDYTTC